MRSRVEEGSNYMNYLAIDWGKAKVGFAVGSDEAKTAVPLEVFRFDLEKELLRRVEEIVGEQEINAFVLGLPTTRENISKDLQEFIDFLKYHFDLPVHFLDEKVTTKLASQLTEHSKKDEDSVAAMIILQNFLDLL